MIEPSALAIIAVALSPVLIPVVIYYARVAWLRAEQRFFKTDEDKK